MRRGATAEGQSDRVGWLGRRRGLYRVLGIVLPTLVLVLPNGLPGRGENTIDEVMADTFSLQGVRAQQPRRVDGGFDWDWRGPRNDPEWAWFFNRHDWFLTLLDAWEAEGDDRYVEFLLEALDDWILTHPVPSGFTISSAWRPLEAARRLLGSWLEVDRLLADHPAFSEERRQRFRQSLWDHGNHLRQNHIFFGNHLVTEVLALTLLAASYPEFPESAEWMDYGLRRLARAYEEQVYPDGAQKELSTHYQRVVALNFQKLLSLLRRRGYDDKVKAWEPRVERMWAYLAGVMKPDGSNPINNDSDREDIPRLLRAHAPQLLPVDWRTRVFPWAGQVAFRSTTAGGEQLWGWLDAGPRGIDHDHVDPMQFSLSVGPANFLVDSGRYTYAPGPLRRYFQGPDGHNLILLDGKTGEQGPRRVSRPGTLLRVIGLGGPVELAWGERSIALAGNPRAADWRRIVVHLPGYGWAVIDVVISFGPRELTTLWHWDPLVVFDGDGALPDFSAAIGAVRLRSRYYTTNRHAAQAEWVVGREGPRPQGWVSRFFNQREPAPVLVLRQVVDRPSLHLWLFQPAEVEAIEVTRLEVDRVELALPGHGWLELDPRAPEQFEWQTFHDAKHDNPSALP